MRDLGEALGFAFAIVAAFFGGCTLGTSKERPFVVREALQAATPCPHENVTVGSDVYVCVDKEWRSVK